MIFNNIFCDPNITHGFFAFALVLCYPSCNWKTISCKFSLKKLMPKIHDLGIIANKEKGLF